MFCFLSPDVPAPSQRQGELEAPVPREAFQGPFSVPLLPLSLLDFPHSRQTRGEVLLLVLSYETVHQPNLSAR